MIDISKLTKQAKQVIENIDYIDLATVSTDGKPWCSPLWFVRDSNYNFYFYSPKYTQHSKNIRSNGIGFVVIYDSTAPEGTGFGVYMTVTVKELIKVDEILEAFKWIFNKKNKKRSPQDFLGKSPRRMYKITPTKVWVNDSEEKDGLFLDYRIPIKLTT